MMLYAETPGLRARQIARDALVVLSVWLLVRLGAAVRDLVSLLAEPGVALERAGQGVVGAAGRGVDAVDGLPLVGAALTRPFEALGGSGQGIVDAGVRQQEVVLSLALWLGVLAAALPILLLLGLYLPLRWRWIREASAAHRLREAGADAQLFALRALTSRSLRELRRVSSDPWGDFRAGDWQPLAALEQRALGLRAAEGAPAHRPPPP